MIVSSSSSAPKRTASRGNTYSCASKHTPRVRRCERVSQRHRSSITRSFVRMPSARWTPASFVTRARVKDDVTPPAGMEDTVPVMLSVSAAMEFGLSLKICGNCESLGNWDLQAAPLMTWTEGDLWIVQTRLPSSLAVEAKCVAVSEDSDFVEWEPGKNRILQVPKTTSRDEIVHIALDYSNAESVNISIQREISPSKNTSVEAQPAEPLFKDDTPIEADPDAVVTSKEALPEELSTEADTLQSSDVVGRVQENQKNTDSRPMTSDTVDTHQENASSSQFVELEGVQAVLKAADEDALDVARRMVEPDEGANLQSLQKTDREDLSEMPTSDNLQNVVRKGDTVLAQTAENSLEGGIPVNFLVSGLGTICLPVIAWSEWTLYQTGCGLPPGPVGILGAAEGVSYLVVPGVLLWSIVQRVRSKSTGLPIVLEIGSLFVVCAGVFVLLSQVVTYGYIPSALPDQNCPAQPTSMAESIEIMRAMLPSFLVSQ